MLDVIKLGTLQCQPKKNTHTKNRELGGVVVALRAMPIGLQCLVCLHSPTVWCVAARCVARASWVSVEEAHLDVVAAIH